RDLNIEYTNQTQDIIAEIIAARQVLKPEEVSQSLISSGEKLPLDTEIDNDFHSMKQVKEASLGQLDEIVDQTIEIIEDLPGFTMIIEDLQQKKDRLINQQLTIALFGAFSAGKSSFANALMGEHILPSSPNPMTAAIT